MGTWKPNEMDLMCERSDLFIFCFSLAGSRCLGSAPHCMQESSLNDKVITKLGSTKEAQKTSELNFVEKVFIFRLFLLASFALYVLRTKGT
jgi:hypothetical protein